MPKSWSNKDERQYSHIKKTYKAKGKSEDEAEEIAAKTVNKQRKSEGRTNPTMDEELPKTTMKILKNQLRKSASGYISKSNVMSVISDDPFLAMSDKIRTAQLLEEADDPSSPPGFLTRNAIANAAVGAGVGYLGARALGTIFGLPDSMQRKLSGAGTLAGILSNTLL